MIEKGKLYLIKKPVKATVMIYYHAPYSYGNETMLPAGLIVRLEHDILNEAQVVSVIPANYESWEEAFVRSEMHSKAYSGYTLVVDSENFFNNSGLTRQTCPTPEQLLNFGAIQGCLVGTAIGDSMGLPYEGLSRQRVKKFIKMPLQQSLILGFGLVSDDTEHTCLVTQSLIKSAGKAEEFKNQMARRLRKWFLALPAGIGMATLKASLKLTLGFSPEKSGVYSAGNGPMMRSSILGVFAGEQNGYLNELVRINTQITHSDPKAELSALMVAQAAYLNANHVDVNTENFPQYFQAILDMDEELNKLMSQVLDSVKARESVEEFCIHHGMDKGVSGYCYQSLPVVMHCYLSFPNDFVKAINSIVKCGGDTDTIAAIAGGIIGSRVGIDGIPEQWLSSLKDWPCSIPHMRFLAKELAYSKLTQQPGCPADSIYPLLLIRNLMFMLIVLAHGFRRLLPPY